MTDWNIYAGSGKPHQSIIRLPDPPRWRTFSGKPNQVTGLPAEKDPHYISSGEEEVTLVNAALYLRRPLLVTGKPGCGKSSLARAVAYELQLGRVLYWPITSRSTLLEGLYSYDAVGRLQEAHLLEMEGKKRVPDIGKYIRLGPLGTALLPANKPRVLLIDEIDKSDIDLPNDLLHIFEEGQYEIPELSRLAETQQKVTVRTYDGSSVEIPQGMVITCQFPFVVLTSNHEKEFPPPFLRRCIRLEIPQPGPDKLAEIVHSQLGQEAAGVQSEWIQLFLGKRDKEHRELATDQLLNAIHILTTVKDVRQNERQSLEEALLKSLNED